MPLSPKEEQDLDNTFGGYLHCCIAGMTAAYSSGTRLRVGRTYLSY